MKVATIIKPSDYHDSVSLMLVARELSQKPGVDDAAVVMATPANKGILENAGLLTPEADSASSNDLVIAVRATDEAMVNVPYWVDLALQQKQESTSHSDSSSSRPKSIRSALKASPSANLAVISVSGRYAAAEAMTALSHGLHVLLFSDNVSLEEEISLKQFAAERGLLLMGPGAGTAIINGVALGFANVVAHGPVGIVSAAGTGLQEVSTLLDRFGSGITQGIGTGGRDLHLQVGGMMMTSGLRALQMDPDTEIIVLISKPPAKKIARKILNSAEQSPKKTVVCFLGSQDGLMNNLPDNIHLVSTLEEAAWKAAKLTGCVGSEEAHEPPWREDNQIDIEELRRKRQPSQRYLRALFSGGTLCYEAQVIWREMLDGADQDGNQNNVRIFSNAPLEVTERLDDSTRSYQHTAIDLGEEEFTIGRLHPMIDNGLRVRRMLQEASDPQVAAILFDVVLGYGAHLDPATELAQAVMQARDLAEGDGRKLVFISSVTGTEKDPQQLNRQVAILEKEGVIVCPSNAASARLGARIVQESG